MNIFRLSDDPKECAEMHCDKHVVKMLLETAQLLSTTIRMLEGDEVADSRGMYKLSHKNHPTSVWVRDNTGNYNWTIALLVYLCSQYRKRYAKCHASERLVPTLFNSIRGPPERMRVEDSTTLPQCMPDKYKVDGDPVTAYRNYYRGEKAHFAKWDRGTPTPVWWSTGA